MLVCFPRVPAYLISLTPGLHFLFEPFGRSFPEMGPDLHLQHPLPVCGVHFDLIIGVSCLNFFSCSFRDCLAKKPKIVPKPITNIHIKRKRRDGLHKRSHRRKRIRGCRAFRCSTTVKSVCRVRQRRAAVLHHGCAISLALGSTTQSIIADSLSDSLSALAISDQMPSEQSIQSPFST